MKKKKSLNIAKIVEKENYKEIWNFILRSKTFIFTILFIFLIFAILGFFYPKIYASVLQDLIKDLLEKTAGLNFPHMLAFIIYNNAKTSIIGLLLGLFFGIFPLFLAALNGYVLGFVFNAVYKNNGIREFWRILPHGIFELPAFFLSLGLGLRLGYILFFKTSETKHNISMALKTFLYIILPLLIVAGLIETSLIFLLK